MGRIPTNGTAVMISYTALLNTQGNEIFTFRFVVGLMRELPDEYQLLNSMEVEINSAIPSEENTFSSTIHPDSATIPNWQVQEGDQFAVFVYNDCTGDYCPANMNLLSKDDCDSTLYQPFIFPRSRDPGLYNISKNDPYVRKAPVTVNMDIVIGEPICICKECTLHDSLHATWGVGMQCLFYLKPAIQTHYKSLLI